MKAIILAAGKGSRISKRIGDIPKSTLKLSDGTPIIRRSVENMLSLGIEPIVCVGYKKELIFEALDGLNVRYYNNPFYSITNNIASLWFAIEEFDDQEILLTSADLYYPSVFLDRMKKATGDIVMAVDSSRIENGDFYFSLKNDGIINEYGPNVPLKNRDYEYMGLSKISGNFVKDVRKKLEEHIEKENFNIYFEDMLIHFNTDDKKKITFVDVAGFFWKEFDFYEDYLEVLDYEEKG